MVTGALTAVITAAIVTCLYLLSKTLRTTSLSGFETRLTQLEQRFEDHDESHRRLSRSIDNLHYRIDQIPEQVVARLSR